MSYARFFPSCILWCIGYQLHIYIYTEVGSELVFGTATNSSWITTPKSIGTRSMSEGPVTIMQADQISDLHKIATITGRNPDAPEFKIPAL